MVQEDKIQVLLNEQVKKNHLVVAKYKERLSRISAVRANPFVLEGVLVEVYGVKTPLKSLASISVTHGTEIVVHPFNPKHTKDVVTVLHASNLGCNVGDEGSRVRLRFPPMTTETRQTLIKSLATHTEQARVAVRLIRQQTNKDMKNLAVSKDQNRFEHEHVQKNTDACMTEITNLERAKVKELSAF